MSRPRPFWSAWSKAKLPFHWRYTLRWCVAAILHFSFSLQLVGGCGKFFEGTAKEMHYALNEVVGGLPDNTLIWCGHEYTCSNLAFALSVDPENAVLQVCFFYRWFLLTFRKNPNGRKLKSRTARWRFRALSLRRRRTTHSCESALMYANWFYVQSCSR